MSFPRPTLSEPPGGDQRKNVVINAITLWTNLMALGFVVMRVITRTMLVKKPLWWDDWFIILAMVRLKQARRLLESIHCLLTLQFLQASTIIGGSLDACEVHFGFGRSEYYLTDHEVEYFTAYAYGECKLFQLSELLTFLVEGRSPVNQTNKMPH